MMGERDLERSRFSFHMSDYLVPNSLKKKVRLKAWLKGCTLSENIVRTH
jgi:hypothetical protein